MVHGKQAWRCDGVGLENVSPLLSFSILLLYPTRVQEPPHRFLLSRGNVTLFRPRRLTYLLNIHAFVSQLFPLKSNFFLYLCYVHLLIRLWYSFPCNVCEILPHDICFFFDLLLHRPLSILFLSTSEFRANIHQMPFASLPLSLFRVPHTL